jgi:beta-lactamase class A
MRNKRLFFIVFALSVLINTFTLILFFQNKSIVEAERNFESQQKIYPLLSKRILREFRQDILLNFLDLRSDLRATVAPWEHEFSFYFEYLPTGSSIGVNEKDEFYAASLFKLPVVMAHYYQLERLKSTEDPVLTIGPEHIDKEFGDLWKKGVGYSLKASEAISLALRESDNTAIKLIVSKITEQDFEKVYESLDIELTTDNNGAKLTTKGYSSILKALYFSSILDKENSQKILDMLTETRFIDKLPAGVPENIPVAHKIGVFNKEGKDEAYMDCGIVYIPQRPYVLCMLSKSNEQIAREKMQLISQKVYDFVSSK